jgi:predicted dehydrogenase
MPLRVGIVGLGFGERVLLPAFQADPRCTVVGVCAGHPDHAREAAARWHIPHAYDTWQQLVAADEVEAVVVAPPPPLHEPVALAALQRGLHVFCEKPLAHTLEGARRMADAAAAAGSANLVDFEFPDIPIWRQAKAILAGGEIGEVRHARVTWYVETYANRHRLENWKSRVDDGGGTLNDFVSHCFYYLEWLLGPIASVCAAPVPAADRARGADTVAVVTAVLEEGALVSLSVCTAAVHGDGHTIAVYGERGSLLLTNRSGDYANGFELLVGTRGSAGMQLVTALEAPAAAADGRVAIVGRLVDRFVTWAQGGAASHPNFADGLRVQSWLAAARRSRLDGGWSRA